MELNELRDSIYELACKNGFHDIRNFGEEVVEVTDDDVVITKEKFKQDDLCRKFMLVVSELTEAVEAERSGAKPLPKDWNGYTAFKPGDVDITAAFERYCRGSIEEEIADAVIRLADIAGMIGMDLDWWVTTKMEYNRQRPFKHNKEY